MKRTSTLLFFILITAISFAQTWQSRPTFGGTARNRSRAFAIPSLGKGYIIAGYDNYYTNTSYVYDTLLNTWNAIAPFQGSATTVQVAFSINDKGYVVTGVGCCYAWQNITYRYDPSTDTWDTVAPFLGAPRGYATGFAVGGKGYVGCGVNGNVGSAQGLKDFYAYDPTTDRWTRINDYPGAGLMVDAGFATDGKGYVGAGSSIDVNFAQTNQKDFWQYDPSTGNWTQIADFGGGTRGEGMAYGTCDKGYFGGGYEDGGQSQFRADWWSYDPSTNRWTQIANFGGGKHAYGTAFAIGKSGFAGLGHDSTNTNVGDWWEYTESVTPGFATANSSSTNICTGQSITYNDTSNYEPTNWYWKFYGGIPDTSTSENPTVKYDTAGTYTIIFSAWNLCDSSTKTFVNYVTVSPGPTVTVTPDSPSVCNGQKIKLTASGGSGATYKWVNTSDTTDSILVSPSTDTTYDLLVMTSGGCTTDTSISVSVKQAPPLIIQPPTPASVCLGEGVVLTVPVSGKDYVWNPSLTLNKSTGDTVIASPTSQTTYLVTGIDSLGCLVTSDSEVVMINTGPSKPTIMQHDSVLISSSTQSNQWLRNDTIIPGATNQDYIVTISGYYQVTVSNPANGCSTTSDSILASGINQLIVESGQLTVYPNPTGGEIMVNISSSVGEVKDWNLQITDVLGRKVYTKQSLNYTNEIDLSNLPNGVYFIAVVNKTCRAVVPVVKQ